MRAFKSPQPPLKIILDPGWNNAGVTKGRDAYNQELVLPCASPDIGMLKGLHRRGQPFGVFVLACGLSSQHDSILSCSKITILALQKTKKHLANCNFL
jgi:hypothetical protein